MLSSRSKDRIFFTWNRSEDELHAFLHTISKQHPNFHLQISIGTSVHFCNAYIDNQCGQLFTRVDYDRSSQTYTLPYVVGHAKVKHSQWLRSALLRAVYYCSAVEDFHRERIHLEITLLASGYSLEFVESHVQHFFAYHNADRMQYTWEQAKYHSFRAHCFDLIDVLHNRVDTLHRIDNEGHLFRFHYLYELGPRCLFDRQLRQLWLEYFHGHPVLSANVSTIVLATKHLHSLNALLVRASPLPTVD